MTHTDTVHTVTDWYDHPRAGVADHNGVPHAYTSLFSDINTDDDDVYVLRPIDPQTLALALEDWAIWLRWEAAFDSRQTTSETHPPLPADRPRHETIAPLLEARLKALDGPAKHARGTFHRESSVLRVQWTLVEPSDQERPHDSSGR